MTRLVEALIQLDDARWLSLRNPVCTVQTGAIEQVQRAIADMERLVRRNGYYAAGYLAYEAGGAFGLPARAGAGRDFPLVWFALFEPAQVQEIESPPSEGGYELGPLSASFGRAAFDAAFAQVKHCLAEGQSYQVNLTFRVRGPFRGDPRALFADLVRAQGGRYSTFLDTGRHAICSASPELFFERNGSEIAARPMKGTARRGRTPAEDRTRRDELYSSAKQRAENVMIVDMVRNDLGKIAEVGTVRVPELFSIERYPNVWQMTSLVTARSDAPLHELFAAVHPSASVTGAPKIRTTEILNALEPEPRGVYTGAIGYVRPDGAARFNVAIRTAVVHRETGEMEFGIGSGIVWDSDAASEYDECLLKGSVIVRRPVEFELLETLAWTPAAGFMLLERHLARMQESAHHFGFAFSESSARAALANAVTAAAGSRRVRLLVQRTGAVRVEHEPLLPWEAGRMRVGLAAAAVDPSDVFLFHKTTNRAVYARARLDNMDDTILWNPRGEVTEATTANLLVETERGEIVTPPIDCGLLAGTARAEELARGRVKEAVVTIDALRSARRLWLINSVHGQREAVLVEHPSAS